MPMVENWMSPSRRIILIGDAAHAMPPHGGQGGGVSAEDAETLACVLAKGGANSSNTLLEKWQAHRIERVNRIIAFNMLVYKLRKASSNRLFQMLKEWFIWGLMKIKGPEGYKWIYSFDGEEAMRSL